MLQIIMKKLQPIGKVKFDKPIEVKNGDSVEVEYLIDIEKKKIKVESINKINWLDQYEQLRIMHSRLKDIMKERIGDISHFAGKSKEYPHEYQMALDTIDSALYTAEALACKRIND